MPSTVLHVKMERGTSLETLYRVRASSCDDEGTTCFFSRGGEKGLRGSGAGTLGVALGVHWRRKWQPTPVCSCLENPRDDRAWWAAIYEVTQSRTGLKQLSIREPLVRRQGSQVSMRVARGSASWLSSHGRGLGPRDVSAAAPAGTTFLQYQPPQLQPDRMQ